MSPKLFRVILQVSDIEAAARFYSQILGLEGQRVSPGRHYFNCYGTILTCLDPHADGDGFAPQPNVDYVYIAVDDIEKTFELVKTTQATLADGDVHGAAAGKVATRPWGEKPFYFDDPFGNKICCVGRETMFTG